MKQQIISILGKAPIPKKGRYGKKESQDWYKSCEVLAHEMRKDDQAIALILTGLEIGGEKEMDYYHDTLSKLGVPKERIISIYEGLETMHQLIRSAEIAKEQDRELVIVLTAVHIIRSKFLCYVLGIKARFLAAHGIPRPRDVMSEIILLPLYPLFFSSRFRAWFLRLTIERRKKGKL